jgi:hypothetical protein
MSLTETRTYASSAELAEAIEKLEPIITDMDPNILIMACLSICLIILKPNIDFDGLQDGIAGASKWMAEHVDSLESFDDALLNLNTPISEMN